MKTIKIKPGIVAVTMALCCFTIIASSCGDTSTSVQNNDGLSTEATLTDMVGSGGSLEDATGAQAGTIVLIDEAGPQVCDCPANYSHTTHTFGSVFYLPCDVCEVYITAGGATYCNNYGGCVAGISVITVDGDKVFDTTDALPETYKGVCEEEGLSWMTIKTNLGGGFHRVGVWHLYELSYRYLAVSYKCVSQEHESTE